MPTIEVKKYYEFTSKVTEQQVNDIMSKALLGCGYWADEADVPNNEKLFASEALTQGFDVKIHDAEEDKWHTLTLTKFLKGLSLAKNHNFEDYDMYDAEQVLQYALFGKLIYG